MEEELKTLIESTWDYYFDRSVIEERVFIRFVHEQHILYIKETTGQLNEFSETSVQMDIFFSLIYKFLDFISSLETNFLEENNCREKVQSFWSIILTFIKNEVVDFCEVLPMEEFSKRNYERQAIRAVNFHKQLSFFKSPKK